MPRSQRIADKEGNITQHWENSLMNVYNTLQRNLKTSGYLIPSVGSDDLQNIQNTYAQYIGTTLPTGIENISGQIAYNVGTNYINQFVIATDDQSNIFLAQWVPLGVLLLSTVDPNGVNAGILGWFSYDLTSKQLYICTTAGTTTGAVWTTV